MCLHCCCSKSHLKQGVLMYQDALNWIRTTYPYVSGCVVFLVSPEGGGRTPTSWPHTARLGKPNCRRPRQSLTSNLRHTPCTRGAPQRWLCSWVTRTSVRINHWSITSGSNRGCSVVKQQGSDTCNAVNHCHTPVFKTFHHPHRLFQKASVNGKHAWLAC